jgi:predicted metal-dependent hydrolase
MRAKEESMNYERLYLEFIYYFNINRDYFACHEVMEHLWLEEGRNPLLQGLLQVAVGLYHHRNGNVSGSQKLFVQAIDKLQNYPAISMGINLTQLLEDTKLYLHKLEQLETSPFTFYDLDIEIIDEHLKDQVDELIQNPPVPDDEH